MLGLCCFFLIFFWIWLCYRIFLCPTLFLCFFSKSMQKRQSPNIFLCFFKNLCSKKHRDFWKNIEKCWDSVLFALIWQENIEKVWDIEKFCNIAKFRKKQPKTTESQHFSTLKFLDGHTLNLSFLLHSHENQSQIMY